MNELERAARVSPVTSVTDTEPQLHMARLRGYRLARVREQLVRHEYGACLLFNPINIRYATGFRSYAIFQMHIPYQYLFVAADGPVVLFAGDRGLHLAEGLETIDECRPALPLNFMVGGPRLEEWLSGVRDQVLELMRGHGGGSRRLALERTDLRLARALADAGLDVFDANEPLERARTIKSPEEILCMNASIAVAECAMARMRAALEPGMTEQALWSILHQTNAELGGEWIETRLLSSGDRANPWQREVSARVIRPGELVAFDTDMVGPFGYCADISRTYRCGPGEPTAVQRELYRLAHEEVHHNMALVKAGVSLRELTGRLWRPPAQFHDHRYDIAMHGIGMCDEYPCVFYPADFEHQGYDAELEVGMTLCVESFIGSSQGGEGVKLEQMVLVTEGGHELLSRFPFEQELLR